MGKYENTIAYQVEEVEESEEDSEEEDELSLMSRRMNQLENKR